VIVRSFARGELRAVRAVTLTAPNLFGTVQVTKLAQLGAFAREKDLVVEFDDAEVLSRLEEKQLELDQIDEQYKKAEADLAIRNNQDQVELLRARYAVRRAELEVRRNELLAEIDQKKNLLTLDESRRRLKQLESDIKSRREQGLAELAVLRERRQKGVLELAREKARLNQVKLLSPISGLVAVKQNTGGPIRMMGTQMPDIREGDQVQPGMPVADVLDLSELEVVAKVGELDRANLREGQEVNFALDAVPDKKFNGRIKALSGTASANVMSSDPQKKFDVTFSIDMKQLLHELGASPEQIRRILETAEANRRKPVPSSAAMNSGPPVMLGGPGGQGGGMIMMAGPGGAAGPGGPGGPGGAAMPPGGMGQGGAFGPGMAGGQGGEGGPGGAGGGGRGGGRGGFMGSGNMSDEDRAKMRELMQKELGGRSMQDLSQEERQKIFEKVRGVMRPGAAKPAEGAKPGAGPAEAAEGGRRQRGEGGGREGRRGGGEGMPRMFGSMTPQFSEKDLANAKLPPPPDADTQLDVLLRPGLLADVEIIVEKIPNAIHIPTQAVFEQDGKPVVYVKTGSRFEARVIQLAKRSESTMVIAAGLKPGELIALSNPEAKKTDRKEGKSGGSNPMGGMPAGGGK
jgi:multidrug efflux pump subunit AcrA (membrane-fusion protein)